MASATINPIRYNTGMRQLLLIRNGPILREAV